VASWASIDYFGRWKALHYYAKRFFQQITISCNEEGILTQDTNPNTQPREIEKSIRLCVENETQQEKKLTVKWAVRDNTGNAVSSESTEVSVKPLSSSWLKKVDLPKLEINSQYVSYELYDGNNLLAEDAVIFSLPKWFHYLDPHLSYKVDGDTITVKSSAYAKAVEILNKNQDLILSDNYFDMNAGEKTVKIISGKPDALKLRSVYDIR
jgi:beta-mannosidase